MSYELDTEKKKVLETIMGSEKFEDKSTQGHELLSFLTSLPDEEQMAYFLHLLLNWHKVPSTDYFPEHPYATDGNQWATIAKKWGKILTEKFNKIANDNQPNNITAEKLWAEIQRLEETDIKIFALAILVFDLEIVPLLADEDKAGAVTMSDKEYGRIRSDIDVTYDLIVLLKKYNYDGSYAELSAILWPILEKITDERQKVVAMIAVLKPFETSDEKCPIPLPLYGPFDEESLSVVADNEFAAKIAVIKRILKHNWKQRTQKASAIYHVLKELPSDAFRLKLLAITLRLVAKDSIMGGLGDFLGMMLGSLGEGIPDIPSPEKCKKCDKPQCPMHPSHHKDEE